MPVVTLTSDFGNQDYYLALIKGAILSQNAQLNLVDITHDINNYDIVQAAFILKNCWHAFPEGTIHLLSVNDFNSGKNQLIVIQHHNHFFVGPDNGVFSLIFDEVPAAIFYLDAASKGFLSLKDRYASAIGHISNGKPIAEIGSIAQKMEKRITFQPVINTSQIRGSIIHIDNYENAIVNVSQELFEKVGNQRDFELFFKRHNPITKLSKHYSDVAIGERLCLFNSAKYLEIAINMGKASSLLGLKLEDTIQIDFHKKDS